MIFYVVASDSYLSIILEQYGRWSNRFKICLYPQKFH